MATKMVWRDKEIPSPLDNQPIDGLFFVIGDLFAQKVGNMMFLGKKSAEIQFPSGECFGVETDSEGLPLVNIFDDLEIPLYGSLEVLLDWAESLLDDLDYTIQLTPAGFDLIWDDDNEVYHVVYDAKLQRILDISFEPLA